MYLGKNHHICLSFSDHTDSLSYMNIFPVWSYKCNDIISLDETSIVQRKPNPLNPVFKQDKQIGKSSYPVWVCFCKHTNDNLSNSFRDCNDLFGLVMAYKNNKDSSLDHKLVNIEPSTIEPTWSSLGSEIMR